VKNFVYWALVGTLLLLPLQGVEGEGEDVGLWPQWRGPLGTGVAPSGNPPVEWAEDRNVRWKLPLPGVGHSTPVIWGERIFLTTAIPYGDPIAVTRPEDHGAHDNAPPSRNLRFVVLAVHRKSGEILWQRTVHDGPPHEATHVTGSWASASPVTDGEHLFASFGSQGLYALTLDGELVWSKDLGDMHIRHSHGEGSSPVLHGDTLVVNWDHQGDSFVVALDKATGRELWKSGRDEITSWSTPLIVEHRGKAQVVIAATERTRSYDLKTGKVLWQSGGLSRNVVASPVAGGGYVYVANSYDGQAMLAIRLEAAKGEITGTDAVAWTLGRHTPYVPSPLLYEGQLFFVKHLQGFLSAVAAKTGKVQFGPARLPVPQMIFASPVGAADRVYVVGRNGVTTVVKRSNRFEVLAVNRLNDSFSASPAIAGDALYLRGEDHLYCLAQDPDPGPKVATPGAAEKSEKSKED